MYFPFLILLFTLASGIVAQTCSASNRCENGCCNSFGWCGFGPDYCGEKCVADCDRKSECNPGFGSKWAKNDKCPLNVCCSKDGYCGTTEPFCGNKTVSHKTCSKTNGNKRIVGYYEGWASNRPCNVFWPEQIPIGLYTHINFAFATIDPKTFKVGPSSWSDVDLYKRIILLKQKDPDLKIFLAIGGWTFNDPGQPTATTFSDLAASVPRQKVFIESLISFMSTYGFDGVDLDWEYPAADDRNGREVDFTNFPKFMSRLKDSLDSASKGISITLPASYWYLQHFDLKPLAKTVDWFNIMSYDLHGTWDKGNKWTGNFLYGHTNLTEIKEALDLLWRNDVDPGQVVMGLGFYGRSFSATSQSCLEPGCTFESGGQKGKCSRETGILLNSEIDDLMKQNNVKAIHYKKEAVKVATWGDQWVSYDDAETFAQKSEFAQTLCLGGLMVWAISHDTKDAKYNKALAKVANRKISSLPATDGSDKPYTFVDTANPQCKWTNCNEPCPDDYVHMTRKDGGARDGELMWDESACAGTGSHAFCCPTYAELPTCGWYTHHNGKCDQQCPDGTVEVGSNSMYCKKNYQAACCTTGSKSMKLYTTCEWGPYPMCNDQEGCPGSDRSKNTLLAQSSGGTGGGSCNMWAFGGAGSTFEVQQRKLCCNTASEKQKWGDCDWYTEIGYAPSGAPENFCRSGCPDDRVRVAMDQWSTDCYTSGGGGGKSRCCVPIYNETNEVPNPKIEEYQYALKAYINDPKCENPGPIVISRALMKVEVNNGTTDQPRTDALTTRANSDGVKSANALLLLLVTQSANQAMLETLEKVWDDSIGDKWSNLKILNLRSYLTGLSSYGREGPIQLVHSVVCSPNYWNDLAGKREILCADGICTEESCESNDFGRRSLEKRYSGARDYTVNFPDGTTITITLPRYLAISDLDPSHPLHDEIVDYSDRDDCENTRLGFFSLPSAELFQSEPVVGIKFHQCALTQGEVEHTLDGVMIARFIEDATAGRLRSGAVAITGRVAISFFRQARTMPLLPGAPALPGGADSLIRLLDRVMSAAGNEFDTSNFVITHTDINYVKGKLVNDDNPIALGRLPGLAAEYNDPQYVLKRIRACIGMFHYLNRQGVPNVNQRLTNVVNDIGAQWFHGQRSYNQANPATPVAVGEFWREWTRDFFNTYLINHTREFVQKCIDEMRKYWGVKTGEKTKEVLEILASYEAELSNLRIDTSGFN